MRAAAFGLAAALALAACGGGATVATATPAPTPVTKVTFSADLKPENEVPPISNDEKSASGKATVVFDLTRDSAGKITAAKASIDLTLSGLPATAAVILGHIHQAPAGQNGDVKVPFKTDAGTPLPLSGGAGTFKKDGVTVDPDLAQAIIDKPADFYVNFHSKANPGGVVRGQLAKI